MAARSDVLLDELIGIVLTNEIRFKKNFEAVMESQGFTKYQIVEECDVLKSYAKLGILRQLAIEAAGKRMISHITDWDAKDAINLARWCKSKEGKDAVDLAMSCKSKKRKNAIAMVRKMEKLRKRARHSVRTRHSFSPQDYDWISILDVQLADVKADVSSYTTDAEKEIVDISNKIQAIRKRMEDYEEKMKTMLVAAARYKPLYPEQVTRKCWERCLQEHQHAGIAPPDYNDDNVLFAYRRYEDLVLEEHQFLFLADDSIRENLEKYVKNNRPAKNYKSILVSPGAEVDERAPIEVEAVVGQAGPSGYDENPLASPSIVDALKIPSPGGTGGAQAAGVQD